jgi:hypothetical protein
VPLGLQAEPRQQRLALAQIRARGTG